MPAPAGSVFWGPDQVLLYAEGGAPAVEAVQLDGWMYGVAEVLTELPPFVVDDSASELVVMVVPDDARPPGRCRPEQRSFPAAGRRRPPDLRNVSF